MTSETRPKILSLKMDPRTKKYILPLNMLPHVTIQTPAGFDASGLFVIAGWSATGFVAGLTAELPKLQPLEDVQKLFLATRQVSSVEALTERSETTEATQKLLYAVSQTAKKVEPPQTFKAEAIQLMAKAETLKKNLNNIRGNVSKHPSNAALKEFFERQGNLIAAVVDKYLQLLIAGGREKGSLDEIRRNEGISTFIWDTLTGGFLNHAPMTPLRRLIFRAKVLKGFRLTTDELRTDAILAENAPLLANSAPLANIARSNLEILLKLRDEPAKLALRRHRWFMTPTGDRLSDIKDCSIGEQQMRPEFAALWQVNLYFLERYLAIPPQGFPIEAWVSKTVKGFAHDPESTTNIRDQIALAASKAKADLFQTETKSQLEELDYYGLPVREIREAMKLAAVGDIPKDLPKTAITTPGFIAKTESLHSDDKDFLDFVKNGPGKMLTQTVKKPRPKQTISVLTRDSLQILAAFKNSKKFAILHSDIQDYLQSFRLQEMQTAAAKLLYAHLQKVNKEELLQEYIQSTELEEGENQYAPIE